MGEIPYGMEGTCEAHHSFARSCMPRWDYGYQISGIGNRTTLADGNTWNLEHISLIARCLTSKEKRAHELIRHLADYVLVWAGGQVWNTMVQCSTRPIVPYLHYNDKFLP